MAHGGSPPTRGRRMPTAIPLRGALGIKSRGYPRPEVFQIRAYSAVPALGNGLRTQARHGCLWSECRCGFGLCLSLRLPVMYVPEAMPTMPHVYGGLSFLISRPGLVHAGGCAGERPASIRHCMFKIGPCTSVLLRNHLAVTAMVLNGLTTRSHSRTRAL